jgi:non-ribosomal peptide synthetase component F
MSVEGETARGLRELARREGVTLFMLLLAGFQALLGRLSGRSDVAVGTDVAGRERQEVEGLIGFFVNQLVLRTQLSGDPSFRELLGRARAVCLAAYEHQAVPFERVVEALQPERQLNRNPLFQVKFTFQDAPAQNLALGELTISQVPLQDETAKFDLALGVVDTGAQLICTIDYDVDLFDAPTVQRWLGLYVTLLAKVSEEPEVRLNALRALLDEEERRRLALAEQDYETAGLRRLRTTRRKSVAEMPSDAGARDD